MSGEKLEQAGRPTQEIIDRRAKEDELRKYIRDTYIHPKELKEKARAAKNEAWRLANEKTNDPANIGENFHPNEKGCEALERLSKQVQDEVVAHGVASNLPTQDPDFPVSALVAILATGQLKGDFTRLSGGINQFVFTRAPFVLLSNRNENLAEIDADDVQRLRGLRTVLVNGEYEGIVEDLRKAFPWVSFRTAEQINDAVFDKKEPTYHSYEDKVREELEKRSVE